MKRMGLFNKTPYQQGPVDQNGYCDGILSIILQGTMANNQPCINVYDIRTRDSDLGGSCTGPVNYPGEDDKVQYWMSLQNVVTNFHASASAAWVECSSSVYNNMMEVGVPPSKNVKKKGRRRSREVVVSPPPPPLFFLLAIACHFISDPNSCVQWCRRSTL